MPLFVYGTLMHPEIRKALLGKKSDCTPAELFGYSACMFYKDDSESEYPILRPEDNAVLNGYILEQVSELDYKILRYYEGEEYLLKEIDVHVNGHCIRANAFMPADKLIVRYGSKWNLENFIENHLQHYLTTIIPELIGQIHR